MIKPMLIFGARPNFMKIAPIFRSMTERAGFEPVLVHTGQHFDEAMSDQFLRGLELPRPDVHLEVGSGTESWQTAQIVTRLEPVVGELRPDCGVVVGDVTSTLAAALALSLAKVPVAHVEAGLRSRDWTMPEERNRVVVDHVSGFLFTPSADADANLAAEGIDGDKVFRVGNVMIDSLDWVLPRLSVDETLERFGVADRPRFGLVTLHRAGNVDDDGILKGLVSALVEVAQEVPLLFPVHPRTRKRMETLGLSFDGTGVSHLPPLSYSDFTALLSRAALVLTDSGGIQEEAVVLGVPCLTLRENTERPITLETGLNRLAGTDPATVVALARETLDGPRRTAERPPLWDGAAGGRVVDVLAGAL
ncbi:MAG: UDP-N-acetylglucosamine 2-epimerase (non-hydrolyzing) [Actinomycetota bacterium]|nr:UDP-N-acetylglucosamine 2-epimerase (non-hydrolyzing) [Actinomycetota bacterium]